MMTATKMKSHWREVDGTSLESEDPNNDERNDDSRQSVIRLQSYVLTFLLRFFFWLVLFGLYGQLFNCWLNEWLTVVHLSVNPSNRPCVCLCVCVCYNYVTVPVLQCLYLFSQSNNICARVSCYWIYLWATFSEKPTKRRTHAHCSLFTIATRRLLCELCTFIGHYFGFPAAIQQYDECKWEAPDPLISCW